MTKLGLGEESRLTERIGFWRRQLMAQKTHAQRIFDLLFGVVAPVLCFVFDPIVFRSNFDDALFSDYQAYAYMVSGIEIFLLLIWLIWGPQLQLYTRLIGGMLMAGALFSLIIGVVILPFTLLGLFLGIGIFGFIPFLTGLVYLRNGKTAFQFAGNQLARRALLAQVVVGCLLALVPPAGLNFVASQFVSNAMNVVVNGSPQSADMAVDQIKYLRFFARPEVDRLVSAYAAETEQSRKNELKRRYSRLTGEEVEERLSMLAD